jgi:hypothetical protein
MFSLRSSDELKALPRNLRVIPLKSQIKECGTKNLRFVVALAIAARRLLAP